MFAIVKTGGKQYKVQVGETIDVEKLDSDEGSQVRLDEVLLAVNEGNVAYGRPTIDGAAVTARIVRQHKGPKLIIFKYKSKSRYRRRTGHRQKLTQLYVQTIDIPGLGTDSVAVARARSAPAPTATVETQEQGTAPASTFTAGSAAPAGDALPVTAPMAQLDETETSVATPSMEALGDTTLPTSTLPTETTAVADTEPPISSSETGA